MRDKQTVPAGDDLGHAAIDDALRAHADLVGGFPGSVTRSHQVVPHRPLRIAELLADLGGCQTLPGAVVPLDEVGVDGVDGDARELGREPGPRQRLTEYESEIVAGQILRP